VKNELARVANMIDDELKPQINKLRFIRDLVENSSVDMGGEPISEEGGNTLDGLYQILFDTTKAFDRVYEELNKPFKGGI